ncbi:MAG: hypothetical protein M1837_004282 [Sclerophora amabilis]|nr:MAG: hypothetical protein M1837_004282 [Sclerophora amabilis]
MEGSDSNMVDETGDSKGKGKAVDPVPQEMSMDEEEESSDEETGAEDDVAADSEEDDPEEGLELEKIIGQRTRGKQIDFAKAAENQGEDLEEDDDEDEDFEGEGEDDAMED